MLTGDAENGPNELERLRCAIRARLAERQRVHLAAVARSLGLSARTAQRRLHALGTSYACVLDEERRRLLHDLTTDGAPRKTIAVAMGYLSTRSVDRARKREDERRMPSP